MSTRGRAVEFNEDPVASTDMGNVSQLVPSIHPLLGYDVGGPPTTPPSSLPTARRPPRTGRSWTARSAWPWLPARRPAIRGNGNGC